MIGVHDAAELFRVPLREITPLCAERCGSRQALPSSATLYRLRGSLQLGDRTFESVQRFATDMMFDPFGIDRRDFWINTDRQ